MLVSLVGMLNAFEACSLNAVDNYSLGRIYFNLNMVFRQTPSGGTAVVPSPSIPSEKMVIGRSELQKAPKRYI
jgi:hypothetical protein